MLGLIPFPSALLDLNRGLRCPDSQESNESLANAVAARDADTENGVIVAYLSASSCPRATGR